MTTFKSFKSSTSFSRQEDVDISYKPSSIVNYCISNIEIERFFIEHECELSGTGSNALNSNLDSLGRTVLETATRKVGDRNDAVTQTTFQWHCGEPLEMVPNDMALEGMTPDLRNYVLKQSNNNLPFHEWRPRGCKVTCASDGCPKYCIPRHSRSRGTLVPQYCLKRRFNDPVKRYAFYCRQWENFHSRIPDDEARYRVRWNIRRHFLNPK